MREKEVMVSDVEDGGRNPESVGTRVHSLAVAVAEIAARV